MRPRILVSALLLAAVAGPLWAQPDLPPPDAGMPPGPGGPDHRHPMPPMMRELHQLNLSDEQKQAIRGFFDSKRESLHSQMDSLRKAHDSFDAAQPGTSAFTTSEANLEQAEIAATQARIRNEAELRTKIYALLTDDQKTTLKTLVAQRLAHKDEPPPGE